MPKPKSDHYFLTAEELAEFLGYAKKNSINQTRMAKIQGVSEGTISSWLRDGKVLKALRDNVECRVENPKLKAKLKKVREDLE